MKVPNFEIVLELTCVERIYFFRVTFVSGLLFAMKE